MNNFSCFIRTAPGHPPKIHGDCSGRWETSKEGGDLLVLKKAHNNMVLVDATCVGDDVKKVLKIQTEVSPLKLYTMDKETGKVQSMQYVFPQAVQKNRLEKTMNLLTEAVFHCKDQKMVPDQN